MGEKLKESTWFEIFRVGTWHGHEYTKLDLDKMIENFEKGDPRVPLIIGHNSFWGDDEKPAHGWVEKLKRSGNRLLAKARNVSSELVEAVNEEIYPMRSVELWHNYHERGLALGAIAFLGGSNPEVGGMADFQFSKGSDGKPKAVTDGGYALSEGAGRPIYAREKEGRLSFAYGSNDKFHEEQELPEKTHHQTGGGDSSMTKEEIEKMLADAATMAVNQFKASEEFTGLVATNQQLAMQLQETQNHAAAEAVRADLTQCQTFCKDLLDNKKVTPAQFNSGLAGFLASLDNTEKVEFAKDKAQTRREFAMDLLNQASPQKGLFSKVDNETPRSGDDDQVPADVEQFAQRYGLDPKIVQQNFQAQRRVFSGQIVTAEDGTITTVKPVSVLTQPKQA